MNANERKLYQQVDLRASDETLHKFKDEDTVSLKDFPLDDDPRLHASAALPVADAKTLAVRQRAVRLYLVFAAIFAATLALAAGAGFALSTFLTSSATAGYAPPSYSDILECGETAAEALALGCRFDVMLQLWVPAPCFDKDLSEHYLSKYQWHWWYDSDAQQEMPDDIMRQGLHDVAHMSDSYHRRHCAYSWEAATRAIAARQPILDEYLSFEHVRHCNMVLLAPPWNTSRSVNGVEAHSGFARCADFEIWLREGMPE